MNKMTSITRAKQQLFADLPELTTQLRAVVEQYSKRYQRFELDSEFAKAMAEFVVAGKLFRGSFLLSTYRALTGRQPTPATFQVAIALELYCSGLLVQDDIMDGDALRRGTTTSHVRIKDWAVQQGISNPQHFGESVAICYGDVLYFMATEVLSAVELPPALLVQLITLSSRELALLGFAQCEDLRLAAIPMSAVAEQQIIAMQYAKTGRYTGRWPLSLAATLAEVAPSVVEALGQVGDEIGLLYQLRDDYLGLFGDPVTTGKNTHTDIIEGKKTLYYSQALHVLKGTDLVFAQGVFGNPKASTKEIERLKRLLHESGVVQLVDEKIQTHHAMVQEQIAALPVAAQLQELLCGVVELVLRREK